MKVQTWLITGASGLIGSELASALRDMGQNVRTLDRSPSPMDNASFAWDPATESIDRRALADLDVVVHLAGASVGKRWTPAHKRAILESRIQGTSLLKRELVASGFGGTWIQASAVGYYGNTSTPCDENSPKGQGFLADVVEAWENASQVHPSESLRQIHLRLGLVLSGRGGTLEKLWPIYQLGLGAPLGAGRQAMSWIHVNDVVRMIVWLAEKSEAKGIFNATAPQDVTNAEFSRTLARVLNRPHWTPAAPAWLLRGMMGDMASLLLEGQHAVPRHFQELGFEWLHPELDGALASCAASRI